MTQAHIQLYKKWIKETFLRMAYFFLAGTLKTPWTSAPSRKPVHNPVARLAGQRTSKGQYILPTGWGRPCLSAGVNPQPLGHGVPLKDKGRQHKRFGGLTLIIRKMSACSLRWHYPDQVRKGR